MNIARTTKTRLSLLAVMSFGWVLLLLVAGGCPRSSADKIPITSISDRAIEYFLIGRDLTEKLRPLEGKHYFKEAIALDSNFALAFLYLAESEPLANDRLKYLGRALSLSDDVTAAEQLLIHAGAARNSGDRSKQRECLTQIATMYPEDERAHTELGDYYYTVQEYTQAIPEYIQAIRINAHYAPAYNGLGYSYSHLGEPAEAEKALCKYIEIIPNDPNPYDSYAELLLREGRFTESLTYYQKALKKNPRFLNAYEGMASAYNYLGQYIEARVQLRTMFDCARNTTYQRRAYYALAVSYADEGWPDSALAMLRLSLELARETNDPRAMAEDLIALGSVQRECGNYDSALCQFQKAQQVVCESSLDEVFKETARHTFLYDAALVAFLQQDLSTAEKYATAFREHMTAEGAPLRIKQAHELAGIIALANHDYQTALHELEQANMRNPNVLVYLAAAHDGLGERKKALELEHRLAVFYADNKLDYALIRGRDQTRLTATGAD